LVTMEAMAADLPVVAVDASGTRDAVTHEQEGLLTDNGSEALAQAMERVLGDEELFRRFKQAAQERAESLDLKLQAEKLVDVYHQAIEDKKVDRLVTVDKRKKIFEQFIDEEQLSRLLGLEKRNPPPHSSQQT